MEGASFGKAEWDIPRGTEQMVRISLLPKWTRSHQATMRDHLGMLRDLRDQSLGKQRAQVGHCQHPAGSCSPVLGLTPPPLLGLQVKVWRLPESGQDIPGGVGLTLGPGGAPVDALQFHPTADAVLASGAGKRVTVWDLGQQQPLTGRHACDCP